MYDLNYTWSLCKLHFTSKHKFNNMKLNMYLTVNNEIYLIGRNAYGDITRPTAQQIINNAVENV